MNSLHDTTLKTNCENSEHIVKCGELGSDHDVQDIYQELNTMWYIYIDREIERGSCGNRALCIN